LTVAIVIVSHSNHLANGVAELAGQMAQGGVSIVAAGGTDDGSIGTSLDKVSQALQQTANADGTLVLLDLGSAVMITEMAIEMLGEDEQKRVIISSAPLVEGAIVAAVEASAGSTLQEVVEAAESARDMPKGSTR
jgi:PTS hybrid protein